MTRENVEVKGRRYLTEGRLTVTRIGSPPGSVSPVRQATNVVVAECRGSDRTYTLGFDPRSNEWRCTCQARGRCAHLVALQLVTVRPKGAS